MNGLNGGHGDAVLVWSRGRNKICWHCLLERERERVNVLSVPIPLTPTSHIFTLFSAAVFLPSFPPSPSLFFLFLHSFILSFSSFSTLFSFFLHFVCPILSSFVLFVHSSFTLHSVVPLFYPKNISFDIRITLFLFTLSHLGQHSLLSIPTRGTLSPKILPNITHPHITSHWS